MRLIKTLLVLTIIFSCSKSADNLIYSKIKEGYQDITIAFNPADSIAIFYTEDNATFERGKYINNKKQGVWEEFVIDQDSKEKEPKYKCAEYIYKDNVKTGLYKTYTITGKIGVIGYFKFDVPDSTFVYFDLKGKVEKIEVWKADTGSSELIYSKEYKTK